VTVFCDHLGGDSRYGYMPATGLSTHPLQRALRLFDHAELEAKESDSLLIVRSISDVSRAVQEGKLALIMGMEGGSPLNGELAYLRALYRLGLRSLGITHNWRNQLADGCLERSSGGLSHFGTAVVRECNTLGITIDVSHMAIEGVRDTLDATEKPIIASHTNPRAIRAHPHNLPDEELRNIAATGGFVGVFVLNTYLSENPRPTLDDVLRVIDYLVNLVGIDHVGLAPDIMENWDQAQFKAITEGSATFESVPVSPIDYEYPIGLQSVAGLALLREALQGREGYTRADVDKIFGDNALRVYAETWHRSDAGQPVSAD
jgi:membrane dipeptidase